MRRTAAAGVTIDEAVLDRLFAYYELLARWNRTINLTALPLDPITPSTLDRLIVEPLAASTLIPSDASSSAASGLARWLDIGSGGGSPAIPLRIVRPAGALIMAESRSRKAAFLREAARILALENTWVETARFEELAGRSEYAGRCSLATCRAVRADVPFLRAVRRLLMAGGRLVFFGSTSAVVDAAAGIFQLVRAVDFNAAGSGAPHKIGLFVPCTPNEAC